MIVRSGSSQWETLNLCGNMATSTRGDMSRVDTFAKKTDLLTRVISSDIFNLARPDCALGFTLNADIRNGFAPSVDVVLFLAMRDSETWHFASDDKALAIVNFGSFECI